LALAVFVLMAVSAAVPAFAQQPIPLPANGITVCGQQQPPPSNLPPAGSGPVVWLISPVCFEAQGGISLVDFETYLYYEQLYKEKVSQPSQNRWTKYDDSVEQMARDDFKRLWATNFLDNLSIDSTDYQFSNGVVGKVIVYNMEERQRVKIVDYVGTKEIDTAKINDKLKEEKIEMRLDTFLDPATIRKVQNVVRDMMLEKGFQNAEVTPAIAPMPGSPKLVHLTFNINEGPHVKIRQITFLGNKAMSDGTLERHMKENKSHNWLSFISGRGTYDETKFDQDAEQLVEFYRDHGYIQAAVGNPEIKTIEESDDHKTRWIELRIPIEEGKRYQIGEFKFDGNTVVKSDILQTMFDIHSGEFYDQNKIRKGYQKAQEAYGAGG